MISTVLWFAITFVYASVYGKTTTNSLALGLVVGRCVCLHPQSGTKEMKECIIYVVPLNKTGSLAFLGLQKLHIMPLGKPQDEQGTFAAISKA